MCVKYFRDFWPFSLTEWGRIMEGHENGVRDEKTSARREADLLCWICNVHSVSHCVVREGKWVLWISLQLPEAAADGPVPLWRTEASEPSVGFVVSDQNPQLRSKFWGRGGKNYLSGEETDPILGRCCPFSSMESPVCSFILDDDEYTTQIVTVLLQMTLSFT